MKRTQIYLTEEERKVLATLAERLGRSQSDLIREAVDSYIAEYKAGNHLALLRTGRGLWAGRDDLPDFAAVRRELDRWTKV